MPKQEINLLPREEFEKRTIGRFLTWALSVGRYIIIFTELIVILAFLSRFKLDRDLTDLNQSIREKQAVITTASKFEEEFTFLQTRLAAIRKINSEKISVTQTVALVGSLTPIDVAISSLKFGKEKVQISAVALSEKGLGTFLANLSASPYFGKINLTDVSKNLETGPEISFSIDAVLVVPKEVAHAH